MLEKDYIILGSTYRREMFRDFIFLFTLLFLSVLFVYFLPMIYSRIFSLFLLLLFLISKKDYFWFAFFFIIVAHPGYLFSDFSGESIARLPLYSLLPEVSFTPIDFFLILALGKALLIGKKVGFRLKKPILSIFFYGIILLILSIFVYGVRFDSLGLMLRRVFTYTAIISFSFLVFKREDLWRFMNLIFPVVFFIFFTQVYFIAKGDEFINLLSPGFRDIALMEEGQLRPVMGGVVIVFFSYIFSLYQLSFKQGWPRRIYLSMVAVVTFLSIFLSATRIWLIMFGFVLICYILFVARRLNQIARVVLISALAIILLMEIPLLRNTASIAMTRYSELITIAQGRFEESSGFQIKYNKRLPRVLMGLRQNWIFGWGFSDTYLYYHDGHVGNFNVVLQIGIIGFLILVYFWLSYFKMIFSTRRRLKNENPSKRALSVLGISFGAMLVASFLTYSFFSLTGAVEVVYFYSVFLCVSEFTVKEVEHGKKRA